MPLPLLIYYGYPALINGSRDLSEASAHFAAYSMVILGDGLQDPRHPNHSATRTILEQTPETRYFGYIDLGVHSPNHRVQNLTLDEIARRAQAWKSLGVTGILLDDYGYDFANTRERQRQAADSIHNHGLHIIANSWDPRHALDNAPGPGNPKGLPCPLLNTDYYLWESYLINNGNWSSFKQWRAKANTLAPLLKASRVQVISCTTGSAAALDAVSGWPFVCHCAWLEGHLALAWGEPNFSASDNQAPWRPRPDFPSGRRGRARPAGTSGMQCSYAHGVVVADYASKELSFQSAKPWWKSWLPRPPWGRSNS